VGLETLCRAYLDPGDQVVVLTPTYENFFVYVSQNGAHIVEMDVAPPDIPDEKTIAGFIEALDNVKAVYISRPNNPFGYVLSEAVIQNLAIQHPNVMFIIDEAYIEFTAESSCVRFVDLTPNIVVTRTFSKAFGMAGIRLGYLCASVEVANVVNKIRNGKNVSMIAQRLGVFALRHFDKVSLWIEEVQKGRARFESWCASQGIKFFPSHGNFVLFEVNRPSDVCSLLKANGIYVRNRDLVVPGYIRATMGSGKQVGKLIDSLSAMPDLL